MINFYKQRAKDLADRVKNISLSLNVLSNELWSIFYNEEFDGLQNKLDKCHAELVTANKAIEKQYNTINEMMEELKYYRGLIERSEKRCQEYQKECLKYQGVI